MNENKKILIEKFLESHFGNLDRDDFIRKKSTFTGLTTKSGKTRLFLFEDKTKQIYINREVVVDTVIKMFNTTLEETNEVIKNWVQLKYNL